MPEAPDLEVVREFLSSRAAGTEVVSASVPRPGVVRSLEGEIVPDIAGRSLDAVDRRGKFLILRLSGNRVLAINPKLTGTIQYAGPGDRLFKRTCLVLSLSNDREVRYLDERQMGFVYYTAEERLDEVPGLTEQGPDVLDEFSYEEFLERLRPFHGEIKGILTRGRVIAGIGNAYSDEILFAASVYPFSKKRGLRDEDLRRVYGESRRVVEEAIPVLRERMSERIHVKVRDFLKVHNRGGSPCPRCGNAISQITANRRITSYCRRCQPGMLIRN